MTRLQWFRVLSLGELVFFAGLSSCQSSKPMDPGEYTSIAPDIVLTLEYETPDFLVHAHRFSAAEEFRVVVHTRQRSYQCKSDGPFHALIANLEALTIRRLLNAAELTDLRDGRKFHRLRYVAAEPMEAYEELLSPMPNGAMLFERSGYAYETTLTTQIVERLRDSCKTGKAASAASASD